jgi:hypothetical protein
LSLHSATHTSFRSSTTAKAKSVVRVGGEVEEYASIRGVVDFCFQLLSFISKRISEQSFDF